MTSPQEFFEVPPTDDQIGLLQFNSTALSKSDLISDKVLDGELEMLPSSKNNPIRQTGLRWFVLACGCCFLMGSYFCYDIPATSGVTFNDPPYNLTQAQVNLMYTVYSVPNTVLPLLGGIFLDIIGIR